MNLIQSEVVSAQYDALWNDIAAVTKDAGPRPVLILVNVFTSESTDGPQLIKMLEACKLKPEQYNIIQLNDQQQIAWYKLRELLDPKVIFLIGILPSQLGISSLFKINAPNHFNDRIWLATLSLSELEKHPEAKKQLWADGMKPVLADKNYIDF